MHNFVRLMIAVVVSSVAGWLFIVIGELLYKMIAGQASPVNSDFTIINWTVSLVLSGVVFIVIYMKVVEWLGE